MRITLVNLLTSAALITIGYAADVRGQEVLDRKVSLDAKEKVMIKDVLSEIESQANVKFTYRPRLIKANKKVNIQAENESIIQVLNKLFDLSLGYKVIGDQIILVPIKEKEPEPDENLTVASIIPTILINGRVTDETSQALPGVNIIEKGTSNGTTSDSNGEFKIEVTDENAVLIFSFIGYAAQEVVVGQLTRIDVQLNPDVHSLDEIVVVGYGEQKKSVVTGAISRIKAEELSALPLNRIEQSLQGRVSGVTVIASSGQPGSQATVRVRGISSIDPSKSNPLWVIDGVVVDNDGIGFLNQSDIESIEVLKDAASQAIYGTRASTGVILVTTKRGKSGSVRVHYNGYFGTSAPARKLDLLNATQYATIVNESLSAANLSIRYPNPSSLGKGTDWQKAIFNNTAMRQNHELSISGGNEKSTFFSSFGYLDQEGIVTSKVSNYNRINIRLNSQHKIKEWLTVGQNLGYSHTKTLGVAANTSYGGPLNVATNLDPVTPLVETDPAKVNTSVYSDLNPFTGEYQLRNGIIVDANGNPYGISTVVGYANPIASIQTKLGNNTQSDDIVGNVFGELQIIKGLKVRSTLGAKLANWRTEVFTPIFYLQPNNFTSGASFVRNTNEQFNWNIENIISYSNTTGSHNYNVLLGQGAYKDGGARGQSLTRFGIDAKSFDEASFNLPYQDELSTGYEAQVHTISSIFARINYDFDERYLLTAIVRRDGSSRFGENNRYGTFPSFSAGWVASRESFWPENRYVNFVKLRSGYGVVGNDAIGDFSFLSIVSGGERRRYPLGSDGFLYQGVSPDAPPNPNLRWEQTSQFNVGVDATILNDFTVTAEWFTKKVTDMLRYPRSPFFAGSNGATAYNVGDMENNGIELELGYNKNVGPVLLSISGNVSHIKNKVTQLEDNLPFTESYANFFTTLAGSLNRTQIGKPFNSFYGYQMNGIFQTQEQIQAYTNADGGLIQPNARPGDVIWTDLNNDGQITSEDRTFLGNPYPTWAFGFTLNVSYKAFDFQLFGQGVAGNTIFQGVRSLDNPEANWQTKVLSRWTGPGTSNDYPRIVNGDPNRNFGVLSKLYLEDGDYFRIKIIQIGYTLPTSIISKVGIQKARVYIMGENLITFTKYTGYDPEIGGADLGIDKGIYPQARSFIVGVNIDL